MNLHLATVAQLIEWQAAIVDEIARRAQPPAPPPLVAQPPWEMAAPGQYIAGPPQGSGVQYQAVRGPVPPPPQPPAMLAGQRGAMHATHKTDPALLARMQQVPLRAEGAPPVQGNGKGDGGQADVGPKG